MEKEYLQCLNRQLLSANYWLSKIPKNLTHRYSISWDYPRTKNNIQHRQRLTENKLNQMIRQLMRHLDQNSSCCWSATGQTSINQMVTIISESLITLIKNDLQTLHTRFEEKKILIKYDVYDINLVKSFLELNPTEEQKNHVEKTWKTKRKACTRKIHQMRTSLSDKEQVQVQGDVSSMFTGNNPLFIDYSQQQSEVSFLESLNPAMRTIIENRLASMENHTKQILAFNNNPLTQLQ
ncbi:unnamed protein product [Adineta ricciae]|uniref:Uncharacterized protein n=1 Tax=Adineta ricciae TaxID=249248 RepID=A0A816CB12_ADIRI|nr:unnamed protein product [Adineta ricciae]CAF1619621.1 unnamed protein product [Adineta ricciae]